MYYRRKMSLALLEALGGGPVARTDLQKLLFLVAAEQKSAGATSAYEFVPYRYGCYSFQAEADKKTLTKYGLLRDSDEWALPTKAHKRETIRPEDREAIQRALQRAAGLRGRDLVRYVYREYPYYAINSEIRGELLSDTELAAVGTAMPKESQPCLFTIGYEGRTLEAYLNTLIQANVRLLCDVRRNPLSMKFGFSKRQLANAVTNLGIEYVHMPELGIASAKRRNLTTAADYRELFDEYEQTTLVNNQEAVEHIAALLAKHGRIAITCFESDAESCHRGCVAGVLGKRRDVPAVAHL